MLCCSDLAALIQLPVPLLQRIVLSEYEHYKQHRARARAHGEKTVGDDQHDHLHNDDDDDDERDLTFYGAADRSRCAVHDDDYDDDDDDKAVIAKSYDQSRGVNDDDGEDDGEEESVMVCLCESMMPIRCAQMMLLSGAAASLSPAALAASLRLSLVMKTLHRAEGLCCNAIITERDVALHAAYAAQHLYRVDDDLSDGEWQRAHERIYETQLQRTRQRMSLAVERLVDAQNHSGAHRDVMHSCPIRICLLNDCGGARAAQLWQQGPAVSAPSVALAWMATALHFAVRRTDAMMAIAQWLGKDPCLSDTLWMNLMQYACFYDNDDAVEQLMRLRGGGSIGLIFTKEFFEPFRSSSSLLQIAQRVCAQRVITLFVKMLTDVSRSSVVMADVRLLRELVVPCVMRMCASYETLHQLLNIIHERSRYDSRLLSIADLLNEPVHEHDDASSSLIHMAIRRGDAKVVQLLLRYGADPHEGERDMLVSPLQTSIACGHAEVTRLLKPYYPEAAAAVAVIEKKWRPYALRRWTSAVTKR